MGKAFLLFLPAILRKALQAGLPIVPFIFIFIAGIFLPLDPDLGWHLKYGEYFYEHGQPLFTNIYSSSMPGYHWVNPSWATDVITYSAFKFFGFVGLSLLGAGVVCLTFFFLSRAYKLKFLEQAIFFPIIFYLEYPLNVLSFRGHQLSLLFISILLFLLNMHDVKILKTRLIYGYFIPFLFLIWVNVHGQFILGLGILCLFIFGKILSTFLTNRNVHIPELKFWFLILTTSFFLTFINPFGISLHKETLSYLVNPYLKDIVEYIPFEVFSTEWKKLFIVGLFMIFAAFSFFLTNKFVKNIPNMLISYTLFTLALMVGRFVWPFYYTLPAFSSAYFGFYKKDTRNTKIAGTIVFVSLIFFSIVINNPMTITKFSWDIYCASINSCSPKSAEFLKELDIKKPLYTNYNWGGWLIWNYPNIKPSSDGRMHMWRTDSGYSGFRVDYEYEQNLEDIHASNYASAYVSVQKPIFKRLRELAEKGNWKEIYIDERAAIFIRLTPYSSVTIQ